MAPYCLESSSEGAMRRARLLFDIIKRTESTSPRLPKATSLDGIQVRLMRVPESSFGRDALHIERLAERWRDPYVAMAFKFGDRS